MRSSRSGAHPAARIARHFWAPVPWMLEATVALQLAIGERLEAAMIAALLILNVALGVFQENRANAALALLKQRLALQARVRRDGAWIEAPAADLVPGDIVQLSLGSVVPADVQDYRRHIASRPVDADRRIDADRGRARQTSLCRRARAARRSDGRNHRHRIAHLFRSRRRIGAHRPCREQRAAGRARRRAQSDDRQLRDRRRHRGLCARDPYGCRAGSSRSC